MHLVRDCVRSMLHVTYLYKWHLTHFSTFLSSLTYMKMSDDEF